MVFTGYPLSSQDNFLLIFQVFQTLFFKFSEPNATILSFKKKIEQWILDGSYFSKNSLPTIFQALLFPCIEAVGLGILHISLDEAPSKTRCEPSYLHMGLGKILWPVGETSRAKWVARHHIGIYPLHISTHLPLIFTYFYIFHLRTNLSCVPCRHRSFHSK